MTIGAFVLFIMVAVFSYNYLTEKYKAPNSLSVSPDTSTPKSSESVTPGPSTPAETGQNEPDEEPVQYLDFTVQDYDGNAVKLSDYIGTPIVLNFWASWCPPCKEEMPHFNKVSEEYSREELLFLMVDLAEGSRETVEAGKEFVEDNNYTFTVLFDTEQDAAATYGVRSIPTTYFINKEGHIIAKADTGIDEETLRYGVSLILEEETAEN